MNKIPAGQPGQDRLGLVGAAKRFDFLLKLCVGLCHWSAPVALAIIAHASELPQEYSAVEPWRAEPVWEQRRGGTPVRLPLLPKVGVQRCYEKSRAGPRFR